MTKEQLEIIVAMLAGQSAAIVHLSMKVAKIGGLDKNELADSYRKTANLLPEGARNREVIALALNQIAKGMKTAQPGSTKDVTDDIRQMLH